MGLSTVLLTAACGGTGRASSLGELLERFCRYEALSKEAEDNCLAESDGDPAGLIYREEWGPRAQAVLYAIGEIEGCRSRAGPRCRPGDWPPSRPGESLLVERYCLYGAASDAQRRACLRSVSRASVLDDARGAHPTSAASYAVGDRTDCGDDAGPSCIERPFCNPFAEPCARSGRDR